MVVSFSVRFATRVRVPRRAKTKNVTAGAKAPVMVTSVIKLHRAICKILKFRSRQLLGAAREIFGVNTIGFDQNAPAGRSR